MHITQTTRHPIPADAEVVARRINIAASRLADLLEDPTFSDALIEMDLAGRGRLALDGPIESVGRARPTWSATGRLHGTGPRIVRYARVRLWISAWSDDAVELQIRPVCRHPFSWGRRRLRRYFDLAHLAGDGLWQRFNEAEAPCSAEQEMPPSSVPGGLHRRWRRAGVRVALPR